MAEWRQVGYGGGQWYSSPADVAAGAQVQTAGIGARTASQDREYDWQKFNEELNFYKSIMDQQREQQGGLSNLISQYNKSFAESKAANEAKYNQQLGLVDQTSGQQAADVRSQYTKQRSSALQNLARTGMANTTVGSTLTQGLGREEMSSLNRLSDQMLQQKLGVMQGFEYKYPESGITEAAISAMAPKYNFPSF